MSSSSTLSPAAARATLEKVKQKYARLIDVLDNNLLFGQDDSAFLKSITTLVALAAVNAAEAAVALAEEDADAAHVARLARVKSDIDIRDRVVCCGLDDAGHNGQGVTSMGDNKYTYKVIVAVAESYATGDWRAADKAMFGTRAARAVPNRCG